MVEIKSKVLFLCACVFEVAILLVAQVLNSDILLLPCLVAFLVLVFWAAIKEFAIPVLLFFLPFSPLLKVNPGDNTFFTFALILVYAVCAVSNGRRAKILHFIPGLLLVSLMLVVKTAKGYGIDNSSVLFAASLLLAPYLADELGKKYDFYWLAVFFSLGIIISATSAEYLAVFPTIARYIRSLSHLGVVRHSGYYQDPNFYSAHITAAISGLLIMLLKNKKRNRTIVIVLLMLALIYCGFSSVSKSFLVIFASVVMIWFLAFMFQRGRLTAKLTIILTFLIGAVCLLSFTVFSDQIDMMVSRLTSNKTLSDFTTGRVDLWAKYFNAFDEDTVLLMFGEGYSNSPLVGRGAHNTPIQIVYEFGIVGGLFLMAWVLAYCHNMLSGIKIPINKIAQLFVIIIGVLGPWLGLDYLFFDEFFLEPIYLCFALRFIASEQDVAYSGQ